MPAKCMYKATINTKLEDLVKNYIDYIDHVFFRNLADVSLTDEDTNSIRFGAQSIVRSFQRANPTMILKIIYVVSGIHRI